MVQIKRPAIQSVSPVYPVLVVRHSFAATGCGQSVLVNPQEVTVSWSLAEAGVEPLAQAAQPIDDGAYRLQSMTVIAPGEWTLRVETLIDDFTKIAFKTRVPIK